VGPPESIKGLIDREIEWQGPREFPELTETVHGYAGMARYGAKIARPIWPLPIWPGQGATFFGFELDPAPGPSPVRDVLLPEPVLEMALLAADHAAIDQEERWH
jgi:hypothetical protein